MLLRGARGLAGARRGGPPNGTGSRRGVPPPHPHPTSTSSLRERSDTPAEAGGTSGTSGGTDPPQGEGGTPALPPPPTHCCGTSCPNCVWVRYVEELLERCGDSGAEAWAAVEQQVEDENLRMLLRMEIRLRTKRD